MLPILHFYGSSVHRMIFILQDNVIWFWVEFCRNSTSGFIPKGSKRWLLMAAIFCMLFSYIPRYLCEHLCIRQCNFHIFFVMSLISVLNFAEPYSSRSVFWMHAILNLADFVLKDFSSYPNVNCTINVLAGHVTELARLLTVEKGHTE